MIRLLRNGWALSLITFEHVAPRFIIKLTLISCQQSHYRYSASWLEASLFSPGWQWFYINCSFIIGSTYRDCIPLLTFALEQLFTESLRNTIVTRLLLLKSISTPTVCLAQECYPRHQGNVRQPASHAPTSRWMPIESSSFNVVRPKSYDDPVMVICC